MKNAPLFRFAAMLALTLMFSPKSLQAQHRSDDRERLTLRVSGLTSATRDAIARDLGNGNQARLVFACVPAGILVFEPVQAAGRQQVRDVALPAVRQRAGSASITELAFNIQDAEAECAQVRDR